MNMSLTVQQTKVLDAIRGYWRRHGKPPSIRELMPAIGTESTNAIAGHLKALAKKGAIEWECGKSQSRGIWLAGLRVQIQELVSCYA